MHYHGSVLAGIVSVVVVFVIFVIFLRRRARRRVERPAAKVSPRMPRPVAEGRREDVRLSVPPDVEHLDDTLADLKIALSETEQQVRRRLPIRERPQDRGTEFRVLWRARPRVGEWYTMLVYMYAGEQGFLDARADFLRRVGRLVREFESSASSARLSRGAQVRIIPSMNNVVFNPPSIHVLWLEQWQCTEFRMQLTGIPSDVGSVAFYVGPLLIAELHIVLQPQGSDEFVPADHALDEFETEAYTQPYRKIFVSYAHSDTLIVQSLERAYTALGDSYLRDVHILRSGEEWNSSLLARIPAADVFQLCWSSAAKESKYVEQEWRSALTLKRDHFIRPMYWESPLPTIPHELAHIHFAYVPVDIP